jgi:hypothetical protein
MIINRSHIPWALFTAIFTAILAVIYLQLFHPLLVPALLRPYFPLPASLGAPPFGHRSVGATPMGIAYGVAAFLVFVFAALLGARKKVRAWRIGRAETWMRAHIWLSVLTIPLVLFHCGFRPGSPMTTGLLILYAVVMLSGFYGIALQQFIPSQMMDNLSYEVIHDQIPYLRKRLVESAAQMRKDISTREPDFINAARNSALAEPGASAAVADQKAQEALTTLREMLETTVLPYLRARYPRRMRLSHRRISTELFRMLRAGVGESFHSAADDMERWCDQRRQMDLQLTMHGWLHYWLLVHVPASMLLLLWTAWHAISGLFFY